MVTNTTRQLKKNIYLDHAATTPVRGEVLRAMMPYFEKQYGNPSSLYTLGVHAKEAIENSRKIIADCLSARPEEIIFTAGGTESVNLAILGSAKNYRKLHKKGGHIITSKIEHHAVLRACEHLETQGYVVSYIGVDKNGIVDVASLKKAIRPDTFLISVMYANNEVGSIQPIREIASIIRKVNQFRNSLTRNSQPAILFHTDACQATGLLNINTLHLGVDMMTINASKIYGPKGVGALFVRKGLQLEPLIYGGGQEKEMRSGTENVPGIVGFAKAMELATKEKEQEGKRLKSLRNWFIKSLLHKFPEAKLNGPLPPEKAQDKYGNIILDLRLANNINMSFPNIDGEALMLYLDAAGIAVATGSACAEAGGEPSHVLRAMGVGKEYIDGSIRMTLGRATTKKDLGHVLKVVPKLLKTVGGVVSEIR